MTTHVWLPLAIAAATMSLFAAVAAEARYRAGQRHGGHTARTLADGEHGYWHEDERHWFEAEVPARPLEPLPPPVRAGLQTSVIVAPRPDLAAIPGGIVKAHVELTEQEYERLKRDFAAAVARNPHPVVLPPSACEPDCDAVGHDLPVYRAVAEGRDRDNEPKPGQVPGPSTAAEGFLAAKGWPTPRGNT